MATQIDLDDPYVNLDILSRTVVTWAGMDPSKVSTQQWSDIEPYYDALLIEHPGWYYKLQPGIIAEMPPGIQDMYRSELLSEYQRQQAQNQPPQQPPPQPPPEPPPVDNAPPENPPEDNPPPADDGNAPPADDGGTQQGQGQQGQGTQQGGVGG